MRLFLLVLFAPVLVTAGPGTNELSARDLAEGRKIYVAKCAKCHRFYDPGNYSEANWQTWMQKMTQKSKLNRRQADLLNLYLDAYRAGRLPGKPEDKPEAKQGVAGRR